MKKLFAIICAVALLLGMFCAASAQAEAGTFKLGVLMPLSGSTGQYGKEALRAIELCVKQINEAGGLNGAAVEITSYDTMSSTEEAAKVAARMTEVDKVDAAVLSVMSGEIMAEAAAVTKANIIAFGPATSPSWMKDEWPLIYRAAMCNDDTIPLDIDILSDLNYKKIAIFKGTDDNSVTTAQAMTDMCVEVGIDVLIEESFDAGDNDFSAQVLNIIARDPDCVFISVNGETGGVIVKQLRQYGYSGVIVSKESFMVSQIEIAGVQNADYIAFAIPYITYTDINDCDIPTMRAFLEAWVAEYGELPQTDSSYRGYEAIRTLWEAAKIAGANDTQSLVQAMSQVKYDGLGGTLDFTQSRNGYATFNQFVLKDGKNLLWKDWLANGGYEDFLAATGRDR